ncbi:MAG: hypothetical protein WBD67_01355 [Terracidiphilus sp.]
MKAAGGVELGEERKGLRGFLFASSSLPYGSSRGFYVNSALLSVIRNDRIAEESANQKEAKPEP